jgi:NitT/TauT family transport system ATP-binding protein
MSDPLVLGQGVSLQFPAGSRALSDVSFSLEAGQFVSIVGPSGCGKSSLLKLLAGLYEPSAGKLLVGGMMASEARRKQHRLAFVFQEPRLLPWRTAAGNVALPLELDGVSTANRSGPVHASLDLVGLSGEDARKRPHMLSGGMRMRASLARALVTAPEVLLLDEPFAALDDLLRMQLNDELLRIWQERQWTGVFVTHNVAEAVFLSQRVLVMSGAPGTIQTEIEVPFSYPRSPEMRSQADFAALTGQVSRALRGEAA